MSSASQSAETYTCSYCDGPRTHADSVHGSYCSERCYYLAKGEAVINQIDSDHQLCSTCYGRVKTVEPIPDTVSTAADGFQYPTEKTTIGVDDFAQRAYQRVETTRWSCTCGSVDPGDRHAAIQNVDLVETIANFYRCLVYLAENGAIPHSPDMSAYFDALRKDYPRAAYAAGRAVYA